MKKIYKIILIFVIIILVLLAFVYAYFFIGNAPKQKSILWGVDFSQAQAEALKLDWRQAYLAIFDDLGVKNLKLHTRWDFVEGKKSNYFFDDIDWQLKEAGKRNAKIIYVVGMKTGRWPECHIPEWASELSEKRQQEEILKYIEEVVSRYKDNETIAYWQVENEPLFKFGVCPRYDKEFLKKEVALVKLLDNSRQVIVSDSGEGSTWFTVSKIGDIVGTTMYRNAWVHIYDGVGFYANYFFPPVFYWRKAELVKKIFGKDVICIELQAEPWVSKPFFDVPLKEQEKSMNLTQFKSNIEYAKATGLDTFYLWGVEWWYWMKEKQNKPEIWNEARILFK